MAMRRKEELTNYELKREFSESYFSLVKKGTGKVYLSKSQRITKL
jgi:hypothetical protein